MKRTKRAGVHQRKKKSFPQKTTPELSKSCLLSLKESSTRISSTIKTGRDVFEQYCSNLNNNIRDSPPVNSVPGYPRQDPFAMDNPKKEIHSIVLNFSTRMSKLQLDAVTKLEVMERGSFKMVLDRRDPRFILKKAGKCPNSSFDLFDHNHRLIARVGRGVIPNKQAMAFFDLIQHHHAYCKGWTGGCQASPYASLNKMAHQIQNKQMLKSAGLASAKKIISVAPTNVGSTNNPRVQYLNQQNQKKSWALTTWMSFQKIPKNITKRTELADLFNLMHQIFFQNASAYLSSLGIEEKHQQYITNEVKDPQKVLTASLLLNEGTSKIGIHV